MKPYTYFLVLVAVGFIAYYGIPPLYRYLTGTQPSISTSVSPTAKLFVSSPVSTITPQSPPAWNVGVTSHFGVNFQFGINTIQSVPGGNDLDEEIPIWGLYSANNAFMEFIYKPVNSTVYLKFFDNVSTTDIPPTVTYIPIVTPSVKETMTFFFRVYPNTQRRNTMMIEIYVNGDLRVSRSFVSSVLNSHGVNLRIGVGNLLTSESVDGEIQNLWVWDNAAGLTTDDIKTLATQQMNTTFASRQNTTRTCK